MSLRAVPADYNPSVELKESDPLAIPDDPDQYVCTTQPASAASHDSPDGWTECFITARAKALLLAQPGWPAPLPALPSPPLHVVRTKPERGLALYATRAIPRGALIFAERPLLLVTMGMPKPPCDEGMTREQFIFATLSYAEKLMEQVFSRMTPERQAAYMALKNAHTEDGSGPILGRIRTNGFGVDIGRETYSATCDILSRANHRYAFPFRFV